MSALRIGESKKNFICMVCQVFKAYIVQSEASKLHVCSWKEFRREDEKKDNVNSLLAW